MIKKTESLEEEKETEAKEVSMVIDEAKKNKDLETLKDAKADEKVIHQELVKLEHDIITLDKKEKTFIKEVTNADKKIDILMERFCSLREIEPVLYDKFRDDYIDTTRKIVMENDKSFPKTKFPKSVILLIFWHGTTINPIILPLNVIRRMATDFGSTNMNYEHVILEMVDLMQGDYRKKDIMKTLDAYIDDNDIRNDPDEELRKEEPAFFQSKHHTKTKTFKKNDMMFNKVLEPRNPDGSLFQGEIIVRDASRSDFIWIKPKTEETTMYEILYFLSEMGVKNVRLYDQSCSNFFKDLKFLDIDPKLFGGRK